MVNKIYMEGGSKRGRKQKSNKEIRKLVGLFIEKAGVHHESFNVVTCGSRSIAHSEFINHHRHNDRVRALLLVDAEGPVTADSAWEHLKKLEGWKKPADVTDDQYHLMVQLMESWFIADQETLQSYYGRKFRTKSLPQNPAIEEIPKRDVEQKLKNATKNTGKKTYNKGEHGFEILAIIDPEKVRRASPYADRFFKALLEQS